MKRVKLAAKDKCWYAGSMRASGEVFEASESEAVLLVALGRAERVDPPKRRYRRKDLQAEA